MIIYSSITLNRGGDGAGKPQRGLIDLFIFTVANPRTIFAGTKRASKLTLTRWATLSSDRGS